MKKGRLAIEFAIMKDGQVAGMKLGESSGDVALDRPAWGSITASNPFPPLPSDFGGQYLTLRFRFYYLGPNPTQGEMENLQIRPRIFLDSVQLRPRLIQQSPLP